MKFIEGQVVWSLKDIAREMGSVDETGEWLPAGYTRVDIHWRAWTVERVTPRGAWVTEGLAGGTLRGERMWVGHSTRKVAASKAEAKARAIEKRAFHVQQCKKRLDRAEHQLSVLEKVEA